MGLKTLPGEIRAIKSLLDQTKREERKIVFYSESAIYYLYYEGLIDYLLNNSDETITYITSDQKDPVFKKASERLRILYISNAMMAFATGLLDTDFLLFTMTDLGNYHIKRSTRDVDHIYVFHAIMSTHMIYRKEAFDHYDTLFCVGPQHQEEIRATEKYYGLKEKRLIEVGYPLLEKIHAEHLQYRTKISGKNDRPVVLIAPTWSGGNIVESCLDQLISTLLKACFQIVLRPHPETYKRNRRLIGTIIEKYESEKGFELETELTSVNNFHRADLLITDWSGIALEYAFGTERPVLFINTPRKIYNNDYEIIEIDPLEVTLREKIGRVLEPDQIASAGSMVEELLADGDSYKKVIIDSREKYIYNWGRAAEAGGKYILQTLADHDKRSDH